MPPMPAPKGPGGGGRTHGKVNFKALNKNTLKRLLGYLFRYKIAFSLVLVCILVSAVTTVLGATFLQTIIDDYVTPLMVQQNPVLTGLIKHFYHSNLYACNLLTVMV